MATPRFAWGIDIGNRALKAIRLSPGPEGLKIDDFDVVEHEQVLSNAGDNRESLITSALSNFVQRHDLKGAPVAIGVSGQASFARFIKLPPVEPRKIPEIVRFEAIQQIPFPLDEVEWSYQLFQDPNSPDVEVGIFAMRKELVNQHIKYFTDMGLNVQAVQMNPLAVYNAMYYDQRIKGTTMIIDLGAENTDLIIAEGETIWLRSIPIGGNNFTESLVKAFKLKFPKAEELKRNAATSKYGRQILQAMKPVFNDLVSEIQRSIGFYASTHREARIARVLALGGTFRLPGLQKYVQQNLQVDVHRIDRLGAGAPADARVATMFSENILSSVSAYGLAIQALGEGKISSSLLPMKIRREKLWQEKTKWFGAAAAVFVLAACVPLASIYWADHSIQANQSLDRQNSDFIRQASDEDGSWDSEVENAGAPDRTRTSNYQSLLQGRDTQQTLIDDITGCVPAPAKELLGKDPKALPPRTQRQIIRLDRIAMEYREDVSPMLSMSDQSLGDMAVGEEEAGTLSSGSGSRGGGVGRRDALAGMRDALLQSAWSMDGRRPTGRSMYGRFMRRPTTPQPQQQQPGTDQGQSNGPKQRGFIVEVICTTPYGGSPDGAASFIHNTLMSSLQKMTSSNPQVKYAVKRVIEPSTLSLSDDPIIQAEQAAVPQAVMPHVTLEGVGGGGVGGVGRRGGFDPGFGMAPQPATEPTEQQFNPLKDPQTGEDMSKDSKVVLRMVVVLDPQAAQQGSGQVAQSNP